MWLGFGGEKNEKKIGIKHNDNTYITKIFIEAMRPNSWSDWLFVSRKAAKPVAVVTLVSKVILPILPIIIFSDLILLLFFLYSLWNLLIKKIQFGIPMTIKTGGTNAVSRVIL